MRRAFSITRREWPLKLLGAILLAGAIGLVLAHRGGRKKPLAAAAVGMGLLVSARSFRADPERGEAAVALSVLGVPVLPLRSVRLGSVTAVAFGGEGARWLHPVALAGERRLPLWREGSRRAARRLALALARGLAVPLRDEACDPPRSCPSGELDLPLGQRLRQRDEAPLPPVPEGSRLGFAAGQEPVITFPARLRPAIAIPPIAVAALLGAALRWVGPAPISSTVILGYALAVAGALVLGFAADHRPSTLVIGRDLALRGPWRRRRVGYADLEELAPTRDGLELYARRSLLRVRCAAPGPGALRFAAAVIERAARDHARGAPPRTAAPDAGAAARGRPPRPGRAASLALALGAALLAAAAVAHHAAATFHGRARTAEGAVTVVSVVPGSGVQDLLIAFQPASGGEATFTAHLRESLRNPGAGATVPVVYDADHPNEARLAAGPSITPGAIALFCAALCALEAGLALWIRTPRRTPVGPA